jgi:phosphoribosylamine---glycine ligase
VRVLIVGGGGREHALAWTLAQSPTVTRLFSAPGNPGIATLAECVPADAADPAGLLALSEALEIDLTIVGPELPLARGIADLFSARGRPLVGPSRAAAELESSKAFAKEFMERHGVPTARFRLCDSVDAARSIVRSGELGWPAVVKADGLAAGKGVVVAPDAPAAEHAVRAMMVDRQFGEAGSRVVIEEFLVGEEASFFVLTDGQRAVPLPSAQDHKRVFDGDRGPNTGGMGAFAPSPLVDPAAQARILDEIVYPVLEGMRAEGRAFRGFLYVGLMLTRDGPRVVEFNVRLGDPEAQVILPLVDGDLAPLLAETAAGRISHDRCRVRAEVAVGVVLASGGYPDRYESGRTISGLDDAASIDGAVVFHAGTARRDGALLTAGGRVLTVVGRAPGYREAIARAYDAANLISFEGKHMRRDIGAKAMRP